MKTIEQIKAIAAKRAKSRLYYLENREAFMARGKRYYQLNKEVAKARAKKWIADNRDRALHTKALYRNRRRKELAAQENARYHNNLPIMRQKRAEYRTRKRPVTRLKSRERSEALSDGYVREQLSKYSPVSSQQWPQSLVEAKRAQLLLKRQLKIWPVLKTL